MHPIPLHPFPCKVSEETLPTLFTNPFHYTPHPLVESAATALQGYLREQLAWQEELAGGKMLGVLVVRTQEGTLGYLAAFSGLLAGSNSHPYFVPPIYDLLAPSGYFKEEEEHLTELNRLLALRKKDATLLQLQSELAALGTERDQKLQQLRTWGKEQKEMRDRERAANPSPQRVAELTQQSQHQKASYKRMQRHYAEQMEVIEAVLSPYLTAIAAIRKERKERSAALQQWLFDHYVVRNGEGKSATLSQIFSTTPQRVPPAGAGECAAPKLLQYAYLNNLQPIAMGEFWWGASPTTELRNHGCYYPACKGKCEPILGFMLQGLPVALPPTLALDKLPNPLEICYRDNYLLVVNKPTGMLSAPGKSSHLSVVSYLEEIVESPLLVHRLDMSTSGLLVVALTQEVHRLLQAEFAQRRVTKRYVAVVEGVVSADKGEITLPLSPNYMERPRQQVDYLHGKAALTHYEVVAREKNCTRLHLYPHTGRTHQLRLHLAHPDGLGCPIVGDALYGTEGERLLLHAEEIQFRHPITGATIEVSTPAPF